MIAVKPANDVKVLQFVFCNTIMLQSFDCRARRV